MSSLDEKRTSYGDLFSKLGVGNLFMRYTAVLKTSHQNLRDMLASAKSVKPVSTKTRVPK